MKAYPCRLNGAATESFQPRSSSGFIVTTGCTTASDMPADPMVPGAWNGWRPKRQLPPQLGREDPNRRLLGAVRNEGGVEIVARVVAARGQQPHPGVDVAQQAGLTLLLTRHLEVLGAAANRQPNVFAVTGAQRDRIAVDTLHGPRNVCPADPNSRRVELAALILVADQHMAVDFDL